MGQGGMNYQQTLDYLYSQLPMFQRIGSAAYKDNLDNTIAICNLLGNPENKFKSIHIAGTNGKGSTSHLLASILQSAGLKVGLYTSPHLKDFRERIKINGKLIPQQYVIDFVEKYKNNFETIQPSFFEMTVGLAFNFFADEKVDIAVIEVGLGGRLDSTNVITPELSVITNISYDHVALLGDTLAKIAIEKSGIIKQQVPVVIGELQEEIKSVFIETAKQQNTSIVFADQKYRAKNVRDEMGEKLFLTMDVDSYPNLKSELLGLYQQKNIATVLCAVEILKTKGFQLSESVIRKGIQNVVTQTGLWGRWQIIGNQPLVIADTGHNEAGIKEVLHQLKQTAYNTLHFVLGMVNDKDISKILQLLPKDAVFYFCKAQIPRALNADELANQAKLAGLKGNVYATVAEALEAAKSKAQKNDIVFVGGSTFTVAEVV
jgi:dihydrofolate synthase/folylpolyglutamate synthase